MAEEPEPGRVADADGVAMELLPGEWLKVFTGTNVSVMVSIGAIAFCMEHSRKIPEGWCIFIPPLLGACWGVVWGWGATITDGASVSVHVMQAALTNAGAAAIFGRGVSYALHKYWNQTDDTPRVP